MNRLLILLALLPFSILFMLGWSLCIIGENLERRRDSKLRASQGLISWECETT